MNLVKQLSGITVVVLNLVLLSGAQAQTSYVYVPDTVSPEWQKVLRAMPDPAKVWPVLPRPNDAPAWAKLHAEMETKNRAFNQAALKLFAPETSECTLGNVPVLEVKPSGWKDNGQLAVYTHGGAYTFFSARSTLANAALIAHATGRRVISIDYTVAPAGTWRRTLDQVISVFKALNAEGYPMNRIAFYGDSSGGGLAAGATLKMRDEGLSMPAALVLWSPWADITETGDTHQTLKRADPELVYRSLLKPAANAYAVAADQKRPYVSPVYGDFSKGFPPTLIQVGTKEIFLSNAVRLYQAIEAAGGVAKLDVYEGMPHVFQPRLPESPETKLAMRKVTAFVDQYVEKLPN